MITGTDIYNYFKCKRQLHLSSIYLDFSSTSDNIKAGKIIEENSYTRRSKKFKQYDIGVGKVDFIDFDKKIIYETKKSTSYINLAMWQVKYYLKQFDKDWSAVIEVPLSRKKYIVKLTDDDIKTLDSVINYINSMSIDDIIPDVINKKICNRCSFKDYCYV